VEAQHNAVHKAFGYIHGFIRGRDPAVSYKLSTSKKDQFMRQTTEDIKYAEVKEPGSENLADNVIDFLETYYKLTLVNITEKASGVASSVVTFLAVFIIGIFVILFIGLALGTWLGELLNSAIAGYFLTAGLFLLMMVLVWVLRKKLTSGFRNFIIRKIYE
jgi:hypothetical protein